MSKILFLKSPFGGEPAQFNVIKAVADESNEIIQTIKYISQDFAEINEILQTYLKIPKRFEKFFENLKLLCESFNEWIEKNQETIQLIKLKIDSLKLRASSKLAKFILHLVYNRAVLEPDKLNHYEPFSPQVYGETSYDLIEEMLKRIALNENDAFIDLGSGVGNVVLQVAAISQCKICYGFEKAEWPARYAIKMEQEFKYWMNFFGKTYSEFRLYKGDFLSSEEFLEVKIDGTQTRKISTGDYVKELIDQSKLIFVNNFAFGAAVDHQLKLRFQDMLEGAFIVSSKPFCSLNFRINDRNTNDLGAILNLNEFEPLNGHVSWTDRPINYYFQKIDRTLLEKYFESKTRQNLKNKEDGENGERPSRFRNRNSSSPHSHRSVNSSDSSFSSSSTLSSGSSDSSANASILKRLKKSKRSVSNENRKRKSSSAISESDKKPKSNLKKRRKVIKEHKIERKRSKSLDKQEKKTLEKMHIQVSKMVKINNDKKFNSISKSFVLDQKNSKEISSDYNNKAMTKLSNDNLDTKLLKDTKISSKFSRHLVRNVMDKVCNGNVLPNGLKNFNPMNENEISEETAKRELGEDIVSSIDDYFKICRQQYIKYLLYMKSNQYTDKINLEYQKELILRDELINKKEELENQKKKMIKKNISLLKQRAAELGIKDLKSPSDLIECAKEILTQHKVLEQKINSILDTLSIKNHQNPITTSEDKKLLDQFVSKNEASVETNQKLSSKLTDDFKTVIQHSNDTKSVSSVSADETTTATERADDDEDISTNEKEEKNPIENQNETKNSLSKPIRPHSNPSLNTKSLMDRIFQNDKNDSLKSFKIPKQSRNKDNFNSYDKKNYPSLLNSASISDSSKSLNETSISRPNKHIQNLSDDLEFSSSSSFQQESKSYPNYYHPKKKYMMENSNDFYENKDKNKNDNFEHYRTGSTLSTQSSSGSSQSRSDISTQDYQSSTSIDTNIMK